MEDKLKFKISVVMPVYNVEKYLEEAIESVIGQTIGFMDNIQLILVNDGSTDGSGDICKRYSEEYPDNIVHVDKENGGVSSARNAGMPYIRGEYVNFMDSDDTWELNAFQIISDFSSTHPSINIISARTVFTDRLAGEDSFYDFAYKKTRVVNIEKNPEIPLISVSKGFFRVSAIQGMSFNEEITFMEDQLFLSELLLSEKKFGVVREAVYCYRKRYEQDSACDDIKLKAEYYLTTPEKVLLRILQMSKERYGYVLPYYQYLMTYYLRLRLRREAPEFLTERELEEHRVMMRKILNDIDDEIIAGQKKVPFWYKIYELKVKYGTDGYAEKKDVHHMLDKRMKMHVSDIRFDGDELIITGIAREKWISDKYAVTMESDNKDNIRATYNRNETLDKKGFFQDIGIDSYTHEFSLTLRDGAAYYFCLNNDCTDQKKISIAYSKELQEILVQKPFLVIGKYVVQPGKEEIKVSKNSITRRIKMRRLSNND